MNKNIILTPIDGEMRVSSSEIAKHLGVTYKATNNLIKKNKELMEKYGLLPFKKDADSQKIPTYLNEDQAIFLMTLSRNTPIVIKCKHNLVEAYSRLKKKQAAIDANHAKLKWQQDRDLGKLTHRKNTDVIQKFCKYAAEQGSTYYPENAQMMIAKMINSALGISDRNEVDEDTLALLSSCEIVCEKTLRNSMNDGMKHKDIYRLASDKINTFINLTK